MPDEVSTRTDLTYEQAIDEYLSNVELIGDSATRDDSGFLVYSDYEKKLFVRQEVLSGIIDKLEIENE